MSEIVKIHIDRINLTTRNEDQNSIWTTFLVKLKCNATSDIKEEITEDREHLSCVVIAQINWGAPSGYHLFIPSNFWHIGLRTNPQGRKSGSKQTAPQANILWIASFFSSETASQANKCG